MGIVGESGSGKSTLALTILRVLPPAARIVSGQMMFEGEDLVRKSDAEMRQVRGKRIAMILQDPMASLNPLFTVGDQVAEPIRVHEGVSRATAWRRAVDLLKAVRIASPETRVRQHPHEMSGGMRQRIVGAIGMSCEPRLLIADEPTTSLDLTIQAQYLNLLRELQREHGLALIFITHNLGIVAKMCDQLAVMYAGRVVESGPVSRIFNTPAHPYTKALLNSIPRMGDNRERLTAIEGQPPNLASLPPGCAFAPRCPVAFDRCRVEAPPEVDLGVGQTARCWLAVPAAAGARCRREQCDGGPGSCRPEQAFSRAGEGSSAAAAARCARWTVSPSPSKAGKLWALSASPAAARPPRPNWYWASKLPLAASIRFEGRDLQTLDAAGRRHYRKSVQAVFQDPYASLSPRMRISAIIAEPLVTNETSSAEDVRNGSVNCSIWSGCRRTRRICSRTSFPAGSANASPSPVLWRCRRGWSCWTSRCRRWTFRSARRF